MIAHKRIRRILAVITGFCLLAAAMYFPPNAAFVGFGAIYAAIFLLPEIYGV